MDTKRKISREILSKKLGYDLEMQMRISYKQATHPTVWYLQRSVYSGPNIIWDKRCRNWHS